MASPSIRQERIGSVATAATATGNRVVKSLSLRVKRPHIRGVPLRHLKVL
jgi:hypothetical protein